MVILLVLFLNFYIHAYAERRRTINNNKKLASANGATNGIANGTSNGVSNGVSNGHVANGASNGLTELNGYSNGYSAEQNGVSKKKQ